MADVETRHKQSSSPRASSSLSAHQNVAPNYLSARSAEVILSEVRPTGILSETLRSVNVLLDELLWLILGNARSLSTERLRTGLLKILSTTLGKDALLEAEVELRAYIERNPPLSPAPVAEPATQNFPLQQAFELLRVKCEAYSSLGDQKENLEVESTLHSRMGQVAGDAAPKASAVAPAALYLTAILEHICEHVLTNVGHVVARDSSRTTAHSQDLYIALCEDEAIYPLFKTMKVHEQIEQQSKTPAPRRSKSVSRNERNMEAIFSDTVSDTTRIPRRSMDSAVSNGSNNNLPNRTFDKGRPKVLFKNPSNRSPAGDTTSANPRDTRHRRSNSLADDGKKSSASLDGIPSPTTMLPPDEDSMQEFDDLMRSGTTMKVSLTPDRLRSFEVYAKEKNQRGNRLQSPSAHAPSSFSNGTSQYQKPKQPTKGRKRVESIAESPERSSGRVSPTDPRANTRTRSLTETRYTTSKAEHGSSSSLVKPADLSDTVSSSPQAMPTAIVGASAGVRNRSHRVHRPESMDLDDVMDGSEDMPPAKKVLLTPKSAQATKSNARELLDFLSEGPPEPPADVPPSTQSAYELQRNKGRFMTIVSRLTGSSSTEKLTARNGEDVPDVRRPPASGVNGNGVTLRPPPLNSKRSAPNFSRSMPPPTSGVNSPQSYDSTTSPSAQRVRRPSVTRKAVPDAESRGQSKEKAEAALPPKQSSKPANLVKPLPDPGLASTSQSDPVVNNIGSPSGRKIAPDIEQSNDSAGHPRITEAHSYPTATPLTNGHAKQEGSKVTNTKAEKMAKPSLPSSRSEGHPPVPTLPIPPEEYVLDLRRLMSRATTVDECRVLMDMFLAKCGASDVKQDVSSPVTPPKPPIRPEDESRIELNLIEALLGDNSTYESPTLSSPSSVPAHTPRTDAEEGWSQLASSVPAPTPLAAEAA